ncbi:ATP-binding protein [Streptomyces sp. STR69]|uniref:ATP-binding protein n=1 Tax=Streptomyces sp. STR69 TaxID=1796942 RepID=UPI0021C80F09|nr:ATP-binding protein [Streptomyces sp. STR69]
MASAARIKTVGEVEKSPVTTEARELTKAATRTLPQMFTRSTDEQEFVFLASVTAEIESASWRDNPTRSLRQVIQKAIFRLPNHPPLEGCQLTWRSIAEILYGEPEGLRSGRVYKELNDLARHEAGYANAESTFKRVARAVRQNLADILQLMLEETLELKEHQTMDRPEAGYVNRPELEAQFNSLMLDSKRIILLHGDAGTGKSTLARHLVRNFLKVDVDHYIPTVSGHSEDSLHESLATFLEARGKSTRGMDRFSLAREFKSLLKGSDGPTIVLLDNIEEQVVLDSLVPTQPASRVIVTSRKLMLNASKVEGWIDVQNMNSAESRALVRLHTGNELNDRDVATLADALDRRPLAIEHGCALLRIGDETVQELCSTLQFDTAGLLDTAETSFAEAKLTTIYRNLLKKLSENDSSVDAVRLLDVLAFADTFVGLDVVMPIWQAAIPVPVGRSRVSRQAANLAKRRLKAAMKELESLSLVRIVEGEPPNSDHLAIHGLTRAIIRGLRQDESMHVAERMLEEVLFLLDKAHWKGGDSIGHMLAHWGPSVRESLLSLGAISVEGVERLQVLRIYAFLLRASRQQGKLGGDLLIRAILAFNSSDVDRDSPGRGDLAIEIVCSGWPSDFQPDTPMSLHYRVNEDAVDACLFDSALGEDLFPVQTRYDAASLLRSASDTEADRGTQSDVFTKARWLQMRGTIHYERAEWEEAEECFERSFEKTQNHAGPTAQALTMEAVRRANDLMLKMHAPEGQRRWKRRLEEVYGRVPDWQDGLIDFALNARMDLVSAKAHLAQLYRAEIREYSAEEMTNLIHTFERAAHEQSSILLDRLFVCAKYHAIRAYALTHVCPAIGEASRIFHHAIDRGYSPAARIIALSIAKLSPVHAEHKGESGLAMDEALSGTQAAMQIAEYFASDGSPYWHADALVTAFALSGWSSRVSKHQMMALEGDAISALERIGRLDRMFIARKVATRECSPIWLLGE